MINFEAYREEISEKQGSGSFAVIGREIERCEDVECCGCKFDKHGTGCCENMLLWGLEEYKELPTITQHFKKLCEVLYDVGFVSIEKEATTNIIAKRNGDIFGYCVNGLITEKDTAFMSIGECWNIDAILELEVEENEK